ncbi:MAG: amidohydrolase [Kofleriaceae bacterium]|nr:amidohydrolase [Kofleriaceae bacterium]MBP6840103.1 amidohydrolase [Kofleriaceae bacterium]
MPPALVIDAHAHLDERMLDVPTMLAQMAARAVDRVVLIPCMNDPLPATPARLLAVVRGLLRSPLHPLAGAIHRRTMTADGNLRLSGATYAIYPRPDNAAVAAAITAHPDRFLGWIFLNPGVGAAEAIEQLERWRQVPGFVGVKLHPHWHDWALADALPLARRCEELGLPVLVHLGFGDRGAWRVLADGCPRLRLVFAHAGIPHFQRMWPAVRRDPRLWLDVSSPYLDEKLVRAALAAVGPDHLLYGTDAPYGFHGADGGYDYGAVRGWVERLPAPASAIEQVLGGNLLRLLGDRR